MSKSRKNRNHAGPLEMYAACMEEIKKRTLVVNGLLTRQLSAMYVQTTAECIGLQIRKILELIALASMVANQDAYKKHRTNFHRDWNGKRILATLEVANPSFYPVPTRQVLDPHTSKVTETMEVTQGFLSKADFVTLYDECGRILHAHNPFSTAPQDARAFIANTPKWMTKIITLLNHHQIQLMDEDKQIWVLMEAKSDGKVHVYEFERVPDQVAPVTQQ